MPSARESCASGQTVIGSGNAKASVGGVQTPTEGNIRHLSDESSLPTTGATIANGRKSKMTYRAKRIKGEWMMIDTDGFIVSDDGEFSSKTKCAEAVCKANADAHAWNRASSCDAPHLDNLGASPD